MSGTNPIIVITGGNRGIGFEICRQLVKRGAQVVLTARSVSQGADTAVWLALDAPQDLTGKFLRDRKVIPW